jgi:capsular exopolysaccharide synthesis family protein
MELRDVLAALRAGWWLLLLGLLVGGAAAAAISLAQTPLYTSSIQMFVSTTDSSSTQAQFQGSQFSQERVASYQQMLQGTEMAGRLIEQLDLPQSPADLAEQIRAEAVPDTALLNVSVTDPSPERSQQIAEAIGQEFPGLVADVEAPVAGDSPPIKVTVVDESGLPVTPTSPATNRNVAIGLLTGLVIGAALAIVRPSLDRTVRDPEVAAELAGAPLIGVVLRDPALQNGHVFDRGQHSGAAENYRQLRANLQFLDVDSPPKVILVSSALAGEGKTTLVLNLALALVEAGRQVTVIDADLRRPRVVRYLRMVGGVGLTNVLTGSADLEEVVQTYDHGSGAGALSVLGAGPMPPNPSELLSSAHMLSLLEQVSVKADFVLIDAPPVLPVADATGLAAIVDGVLLSVRHGKSRKELVRRTAETLERVGARTLGVVLNIVPPKDGVGAGYGYGYAPDANRRHRARDDDE